MLYIEINIIMDKFEQFSMSGGAYRTYDEDKEMVDSNSMFVGGELREGYDSYSIYDSATKKTKGRYISKTPSNAAMKAARRLFFPKGKGKTSKGAKKGGFVDPPSVPDVDQIGDLHGTIDDVMSTNTGGARKKSTATNNADKFKPGSKTLTFILKKTTRGSKHDLYRYSAELKNYKKPLVIRRGGVDITIDYKIFVTRMDLPRAEQEMMTMKKEAAKMKVKKAAKKEATKAKKEAAKAKKEAKKEADKAKKEEMKAKKAAKVKKEKKESSKTTKPKTRKTPKASKASKASKTPKVPKAPKAPKAPKTAKPKTKKTSKTSRIIGGGCGGGSCNMFY